jgi:hypothetical protein
MRRGDHDNVWAAGENYWPPAPTVPDDPFTGASGAELFAANYAALTAADVRTPRLLMLDRDGRYQQYGLIHGELGPHHVLVAPSGEPAMVDIEGLTFFDVEWEQAWLQMRFGDAYSALNPVELDPNRLEFCRASPSGIPRSRGRCSTCPRPDDALPQSPEAPQK